MRAGFSRRGLLLICLTGCGWAFSFGVGTQLGTHWLKDQGVHDDMIGLNQAIYYLGLTVGSLLSSRCVRQWNMRWAMAGLVGCAVSLALFPWSGGLLGWFTWRLANGLASALSLLPLEAFVSQRSADGERSWNFGLFNGCIAIGGAGGISIGLAFYHPGSMLAFYLGSLIALTAALVLCFGQGFLPEQSTDASDNRPTGPVDWRRNFLCFATAWVQGFLEGGMLAFMPLYLERCLGMSEEWAGILMGVTLVGVIIVQVPVGWLADRCGRLPVLLGAYAILIVGLACLPWCRASPWVGFWLCSLGAATGALYPLGLSLLGDRVSSTLLVRAYSCYLALDCIGSVAGAAAMGKARDLWGENAMFGTGLAAVGFVLGSSLFLTRFRSRLGTSGASTVQSDEKTLARKDAA